MSLKTELSRLIKEQGIVPLYYSADAEVSIDLMRAMYAGALELLNMQIAVIEH